MKDAMLKTIVVLLLAMGVAGCAGQSMRQASPDGTFTAPYDQLDGHFN